jgi:hypothetical protein
MELILEEVVIYPYFSPQFINNPSIFRDIIVAVIASILSAVILKLLPLRTISDYLFLHLKGKELDSRISEFFNLYCYNTRNRIKTGPHHNCVHSDRICIMFLGKSKSKYLKEFNLDGRESKRKYHHFLEYVEKTPRIKVKNELNYSDEQLDLLIRYAKIKCSIVNKESPYYSLLNPEISWEGWKLE